MKILFLRDEKKLEKVEFLFFFVYLSQLIKIKV